MASRDLLNTVKDLSRIINTSDVDPNERNEQWTKAALIYPVLGALGWDISTDFVFESHPVDTEGFLDFVLKCQHPIGVEAKALHIPVPRDLDHPQIKKGINQARARGASYFIWTNGDSWQFFSLALEKAPIYQVNVSTAGGDAGQDVTKRLSIIRKEEYAADPKIVDEAIRQNWTLKALPEAWHKLRGELVAAIRNLLPEGLHIEDTHILEFLNKLQSGPYIHVDTVPPPIDDLPHPPEDWGRLLDPLEHEYERARKRFSSDLYQRLGSYLISEHYRPWHHSKTWHILKLSNDPSEKKRVSNVIRLFWEWKFIKGTDRYELVEESVPILKKLFGKLESP